MMERRLPDQLIMANAATCHALFKEWLGAEDSEILLLGDAVTELDTAGLQLLLSLFCSATCRQKSVRIAQCSPALRRVLEFAAVADKFLTNEGGRS